MRVLITVCSAFVLLACSDPKCATGELKLGITCVPIPHDGATHDAEAAAEAGIVEPHLDGGYTQPGADASPRASPDSGQGVLAESDGAAPAPRCGDGLVNGTEVCDSLITEGLPGACPTKASCKTASACLAAQLSGSAATCDAVCTTAPLTQCQSGDACCPTGCKKSNDADCSSTCGNGVIDTGEGETCEGNVGSGCPTSSSCRSAEPCNPKMLTGSAENCNAACIATAITATSGATRDGCCPPGVGATYNSDHDCAGCGDQVVQAPELCDGNCPSLGSCDDSNPCTRNTLSGSAGTCDAVCTFPPITASTVAKDSCCPAGATFSLDLDCPGCGNGVLEAGEQCDDGNPYSHDGCDTTCNLDDNTNTPGDDRPGRT
ncbi:MAG: Multiple EGF-like-domain protein 3 precursor, partial [Myxococcaceae bacterium]|nr:Multiple EGF-like-domain protein 3 precursor [Myxococcaceae bacterium]